LLESAQEWTLVNCSFTYANNPILNKSVWPATTSIYRFLDWGNTNKVSVVYIWNIGIVFSKNRKAGRKDWNIVEQDISPTIAVGAPRSSRFLYYGYCWKFHGHG
jgi:hypothetical protein